MIDVNKPIEVCVDGVWYDAKVVCPVNYMNPLFTHLAVVSVGAYETALDINTSHHTASRADKTFSVRNKPPVVAEEHWWNLYDNGFFGAKSATCMEAKMCRNKEKICTACICYKKYSDGTHTWEIVED